MPLNRFDRCASVASSVRDGAACSLLSCVVATTVVVGASLATLSGCEQSSARAERNAAKEIDSVTQALAAKRLPNPSLADADAVAKARNDLGALANRLTALQGAAPGQMSAANLLAASIEADRGRLAVDRLRLIDAQLRDERSGLATLIATGFALDALASAAERFDPSKDRADLARLRAEAGERVEELKQRAAKLAEPIAQLAAESDSSRAALQELDRSEMDLRSQARAAGPVMGYRFVEQASQKRGEADALRIRMARNDVQLMELKPEQSFAVTDAAQREEIMAQLAAASNDLKAMADDAKAIAEASRKRIGAIREQIARELEAIAGQTNGPAAELASQAEEDFTKSAQLAQRAAGPDAGRDMALAGKESVATAKLALARLAWGQVLALNDESALLQGLAAGGSLFGDPSQFKSRLDAIEKQRAEAVERAKGAATSALESVGQAAGESPTAATLKANLTALIDALSGKAPAVATSSSPSGGGAGPGSGADGAAPGGFESPQALLDFLKHGDFKNAATWRAMPGAYKASSGASRAALDLMRMLGDDSADLNAAIVERFGLAAMRDPALTGGFAMPDWNELTVADVTDTKATLAPDAPGSKPLPLVKSGGRWFIDFDGMLAAVAGSADAAQAQQQMMGQQVQQLQAMRPQLKEAYAAIAAKVKSGQITSVEQIRTEMMQAIMSKMAGSAGGPDAEAMKKAMEEAAKQLQDMSPEERQKLMEKLGGTKPPQ